MFFFGNAPRNGGQRRMGNMDYAALNGSTAQTSGENKGFTNVFFFLTEVVLEVVINLEKMMPIGAHNWYPIISLSLR